MNALDDRRLDVDDPYSGDVACSVPLADDATIDALLDRAREGARAWRTTTVPERMALCERAVAAMESGAEAIASSITRMMGKPIAQARGEVKGMAARARYMIAIAESSLADTMLQSQ